MNIVLTGFMGDRQEQGGKGYAVEKTIEIINELQKEGLIRNYAIGDRFMRLYYGE